MQHVKALHFLLTFDVKKYQNTCGLQDRIEKKSYQKIKTLNTRTLEILALCIEKQRYLETRAPNFFFAIPTALCEQAFLGFRANLCPHEFLARIM